MTVRMKRISRWALALLVALAAPAAAAEIIAPPAITPAVPGEQGLFSLFDASPGVWSPADAEPAYAWLRCNRLGLDCTPIDGACSRRYRTGESDLNMTLRVRLTVAEPGGATASAQSAPTVAIEAKPYSIPIAALPDSCVEVDRSGPGTGSFESGVQPEPQPGPVPAPEGGLLTFIRPFPVVRVAGRFTRRYTTVTHVSVRAPRGVRIHVACRGKGCAYRRRAMSARRVRVRSLQRRYRPGATLVIRVTKPGHIGKYVRLRIRSGRAPLRIDRCLTPGRSRPVECPAA
jgi:hypothetical protein